MLTEIIELWLLVAGRMITSRIKSTQNFSRIKSNVLQHRMSRSRFKIWMKFDEF